MIPLSRAVLFFRTHLQTTGPIFLRLFRVPTTWHTGSSVSSVTDQQYIADSLQEHGFICCRFICCRLEYSCPVWSPALLSDIRKLESHQRAFNRHIMGCKGVCYCLLEQTRISRVAVTPKDDENET